MEINSEKKSSEVTDWRPGLWSPAGSVMITCWVLATFTNFSLFYYPFSSISFLFAELTLRFRNLFSFSIEEIKILMVVDVVDDRSFGNLCFCGGFFEGEKNEELLGDSSAQIIGGKAVSCLCALFP